MTAYVRILGETSPESRFWRHVTKSDECWEWRKPHPRTGYGKLKVNGKSIGAHRFSFELHFGPIPAGLHVCHRCDNPRCVRPDHLFIGTPLDNARDRDLKGRHRPPRTRGSRNGASKLTEIAVVEIKALTPTGCMKELADIGKRYGVHASTIDDIFRRRRWQHI